MFWGVGKWWGRCEKVCWDVGEVGGDVGKCWARCEKVSWGVSKGERRRVKGREVWESVLGCLGR